MGTLRTRTVGGTVVLALLLVLAGCSGGGADGTPAATDIDGTEPTATVNATETGTATTDDAGVDGGDGTDAGLVDGDYVFDDGEGYGYVVTLPNGTTGMSWAVASTAEGSPKPYRDVTVSVGFDRFGTNVTAPQADIFAEVIGDGSVGESFLHVRTPVVLAAGRDLRVGNSWTVQGGNVTVGDGFEPAWDEATAEITGRATVAGETCYRVELSVSGDEAGPASCINSDWPFALAVDTPTRDYRLVEFDRP